MARMSTSTLRTVRRAISAYGGKEWPRLFLSVVLLLAASGATVLQPWPVKIVVDVVLGGAEPPRWMQPALVQLAQAGHFAGGVKSATLFLMCLSILAVQGLIGGCRVLGDFILVSAGQRMVCRVRCGLFDFVQRQSLRFHHERAPGDTHYRILTDTQSFHDLFEYGLAPALTAILTLAGIAVVVLDRDPALATAMLLVALPLVALVGGFDRWVSRSSTRCHESESEVSKHVQENLQGVQVVQAFGRENDESARFLRNARTCVKAHLRLQALKSGSQAVIDIFLAGGVGLVVWMAGSRALAGTMTPGDLVLLVSYLWMLYEPIAGLAYVVAYLQESAAGIRRVFEVLDAPEAVADRPDSQALPAACEARISFRDVWFSYGSARAVLKGLTLELEPGTSVAVLGTSGAGKTTLANLLLRFAEPTRGTVSVDGIDVRQCTRSSLREKIAFVPQEPILFQGTIRENIAFGKPTASDGEIERAARAAGIHEHIMGLADAYATRVGHRGAVFSTGQRQRLSIARAFLRDAPFLVLDEPTSSLDVETEAGVLESLRSLMSGRTTILISHRLATAAITDRLVILRDGTVAETGTYQELLRRPSLFRRMYRLSRLVAAGEYPPLENSLARLSHARPAGRGVAVQESRG
jgi:ATP-binding cassette subfamily B protein/subfamily B ATP-binding cassette protein MsbA